MNNKLLSIGETSKLLGISIQTLRLWDKKGIIKSFRPAPTGKRFYRREDIESFLNRDSEQSQTDTISLAKNWTTSVTAPYVPSEFYCETDDVFSARLQSLSIRLEKFPELKNIFPLLIAIAGEIGNNSFNHNIGNWPDTPGIFFAYDLQKKYLVLADRGQGVLKTLQRVLPDLKTDREALEVAFTKYISGRAPEDRGNGLKFVKDIVTANKFILEFYTGNAYLELKEGSSKLDIKTAEQLTQGCLALIKY